MSALSHRAARRGIRRLFVEGPAAAPRALYQHVAHCTECAALFSRYEKLERRLCGAKDEPTVFAVERMEAGLLERLEPSGARARESSGWMSRWWLAPVPIALVLALWLVPKAPTSDRVDLPAQASLQEIWTAKGGQTTANADVGVRVFRVRGAGAGEADGLSMHDLATFSYTNQTELHYLTLFGLQGDNELRWYYPTYGESASQRIERGVVDEPLGHGFDLSINHEPGALQIVALFSATPLSPDTVQSWLTEAGELEVDENIPAHRITLEVHHE